MIFSKADVAKIRRALAVLELPPLDSLEEAERRVREFDPDPAKRGPNEWWAGPGALAGTLVGLLTTLDLLPRLVGAAGLLIAIISGLVLYREQRKLPPPPSQLDAAERAQQRSDARSTRWHLKREHKQRERQLRNARRDLAALGLEADPAALRTVLDSLAATTR